MPIRRKSLLRDMASEVVDASRGRGRKMEGDQKSLKLAFNCLVCAANCFGKGE
jgi:hypothetical protein